MSEKWRIWREYDQWLVNAPGLPVDPVVPTTGCSAYFPTHAEAVAYVSTQQKQAASANVKANPKAALALLVLAGLAAAAKKKGKQS